ncbi:hypothetical protein X760_30945 [Mesorhizobium sp. LSHC422A00]|nr:hypothetical protein X760_30945 [Mesorhizobium sp. LSHC422A00]
MLLAPFAVHLDPRHLPVQGILAHRLGFYLIKEQAACGFELRNSFGTGRATADMDGHDNSRSGF